MEVVAVSVPETRKIYFLSPNNLELKRDDEVVFESENGLMVGYIKKETYDEDKNNLILPLNKVLRLTNKEDKKVISKNKKVSDEALAEAKKLNNSLELNMNFVDAYLNFDGSQLLFSFLADDRVDFRELAKKLAQKYKTRIELRQIGVRDKSKKIGGLGPCGLFLCCNSFLTDFNSVSINMAKNQMLALNPTKINGICGRLLCCLGFENDTYTELKKDFPKIGSKVETSFGEGEVVAIDLFRRNYSVDLGEKGITKIELGEKDGKNI